MLLSTQDYVSFLYEELGRRSRANPRYSLRAFARDLGLSPGGLSELLGRKRPLTHKGARRIAHALGLTPVEGEHLQNLVDEPGSRRRALPAPRPLADEAFAVVSDWLCFAVLNLADTADFRADELWIARRLGVSRAEIRVALDRLRRAGLAEGTGRRLSFVKDYVLAPADVPSEAVRAYHRQMLERAGRALDLEPVERREISGVGLALDPRAVPAIKRELSAFLDHIVEKYGGGTKKSVYHLGVAFFRLTQGDDHE